MAVINEPSTIASILASPAHALELVGAGGTIRRIVNVAASDDDGSKWILGIVKGLARIISIDLNHDVITGGSSYDVGVYDMQGVLISANALASGLDLSAGNSKDGLAAVSRANRNKMLYELIGHVDKINPASGETLVQPQYLIVLTANTAGTAAGSIVSTIEYRIW